MDDHGYIDGRDITEHPLASDGYRPGEYRKVGTVLAMRAPTAGSVGTPEGVMSFEAGDYIVTDDPPTHAWPVKADVFDRTYRSAREDNNE